jgi:uncharacterized membrane protein
MTTQPYSDSVVTCGIERVVSTSLSHWLALVLISLLIFVTLPFFAPIAMAAGWTGLGEWIYWIYSPFCHQLPQRSWFLFGPKLTYTLDEISQVYPHMDIWHLRYFYGTSEMGWKVAWSDRMISWYSMIPILGLAYALLRHLGKPPRPMSFRLFLWLLLPLVLDGGTHLLSDLFTWGEGNGFRDTNIWLAILTDNAWPAFYAGDHLGTFNWWMRLLTGLLGAWVVVFWVFPWIDHWMTTGVAHHERPTARI